jgi:hypothetical protein
MRTTHRNHEVDNGHINVIFKHVRVIIVALEKECVTYSECLSIALVIRHEKRMRHVIVIFRPSGSTMFFHIDS